MEFQCHFIYMLAYTQWWSYNYFPTGVAFWSGEASLYCFWGCKDNSKEKQNESLIYGKSSDKNLEREIPWHQRCVPIPDRKDSLIDKSPAPQNINCYSFNLWQQFHSQSYLNVSFKQEFNVTVILIGSKRIYSRTTEI